jgi:hypothetical protein
MTDFVKSTNFASKDSLSIGNPLKIVKGTEIDTEFNNIATAVATKADIANPTFTGVPSAPTASAGTNSTQLATTAYADSAITAERTATATLTNKSLTSPSLTGTPTAPTAAVNTNTTQVATTAFVTAQIADDAPTKTGGGASGTCSINVTGNAATATTDSLHFGVGQTWQDVGASRAANTTYVNTTGKPIMVNIYWGGSNGAIVATVNGVGFTICANGGFAMAGNVIVPTGATYSINAFSTWHELR